MNADTEMDVQVPSNGLQPETQRERIRFPKHPLTKTDRTLPNSSKGQNNMRLTF